MPGSDILKDLLRYVIFEVQEQGAELFRTRLVKLLYLVEVEHFRSMGKRLTDLTWIRYYYGPFTFELERTTRSLGFSIGSEDVDFQKGAGIRYTIREDRPLYDLLPAALRGTADRVIRRWANEDLGVLLDYVYTETEPMKGVAFGQTLDFRGIDRSRRRTFDYQLDLPADQVQALKEMVQREGTISRGPSRAWPEASVSAAMVGIEASPDLSALGGKVRPASSDDIEGPAGSE